MSKMVPPQADPQIGRTLGGKYRIATLLGQGGMGRVYRAVQLSVNRPVAIKLITGAAPHPPEWAKRFQREAEAMARLSHPNSVRLFDFGVTDADELYMVMELLEGTDLARHLSDHGPMQLLAALQITRQVLLALAEAHALGIVHRDIKPDNVFLARVHGGESIAKVMDFGIAGLERVTTKRRLTSTGVVIGTPAYMSPEQAQGLAVDARTDLYSLGIMLFELLTCQPVFVSSGTVSLLVAHVTQPPRRLKETGVLVPQRTAVQALLDRLLAKEPRERPSLEAALEAVAELADKQAQASGVRSSSSRLMIAAPIVPARATDDAFVERPVSQLHALKTRIRARHTPGLFLFSTGAALLAGSFYLLRFFHPPLLNVDQQAQTVMVMPKAQGQSDKPSASSAKMAVLPGPGVLHIGGGVEKRAKLAAPPRREPTPPVSSPTAAPVALPPYQPAAPPEPEPESATRTETSLLGAADAVPRARRTGQTVGEWRRPLSAADDLGVIQDPGPRAVRHAIARFIGRLLILPPAAARRAELLRYPLPFPNVRSAWLAFDGGVIDRVSFHEAVWMLRERRRQRTEVADENYAHNRLDRDQYTEQHNLISLEFWGE